MSKRAVVIQPFLFFLPLAIFVGDIIRCIRWAMASSKFCVVFLCLQYCSVFISYGNQTEPFQTVTVPSWRAG